MEKTILEKISLAASFQGQVANPSSITIGITEKDVAAELERLKIAVPEGATEVVVAGQELANLRDLIILRSAITL